MRLRYIDLLKPAIEALSDQHEITRKLTPIKIKVLQRDNRTWKEEKIRPVFVNELNGKPYTDVKEYNKRFFIKHLQGAEVRHRCASLLKHSFASQMLTQDMPIEWICDQMGHTSDAMLRRKYGKHFKKERKVNPADIANKKFGF